MEFDLLKHRYSVRKFETRPVDKDILKNIIDVARLAPTARNEQPWEFVAVTDPETLQKVAAMTDNGKFIAEAPSCVIVFCKNSKYYLEDGSAATTYVLLAATGLGLGSCWVAGDKKSYAEDIRKALGVPAEYRLVSLIPLGYAAEHHPKSKRLLDEVLHWEKF